MAEFELVTMFQTYIESQEIKNDFKDFWQPTWYSITHKCLNVAKHTFIMRKAFELFKTNYVCHEIKYKSRPTWTAIFIDKDEAKILSNLCKHVAFDTEQFLYFGLNHHKNRCRKFHRQKILDNKHATCAECFDVH